MICGFRITREIPRLREEPPPDTDDEMRNCNAIAARLVSHITAQHPEQAAGMVQVSQTTARIFAMTYAGPPFSPALFEAMLNTMLKAYLEAFAGPIIEARREGLG
jgi:hypothetical protein